MHVIVISCLKTNNKKYLSVNISVGKAPVDIIINFCCDVSVKVVLAAV